MVEDVPEPEPPEDGAVIRVMASGICLSDWHGWMGHDPLITLPHVPGHEFAGEIEATGASATRFRRGDRVTIPFVAGCGSCPQCCAGNHHICDNQYQPGFSGWGSFAEFVAVRYADVNLVPLPGDIDYVSAASLGCRFATAYRGIVEQGRVKAGDWLVVFGCGGVGLAAIMIAKALGARPIGIDIETSKLAKAAALGAEAVLDARAVSDIVEAIRDLTSGGAAVSVDALGSPETSSNSIASLRKQGRHVQLGLLVGEQSSCAVPMDLVIARELEIVGSHGMQAHKYEKMLAMVLDGKLEPSSLVGRTVALEDAVSVLPAMDRSDSAGITVINRF